MGLNWKIGQNDSNYQQHYKRTSLDKFYKILPKKNGYYDYEKSVRKLKIELETKT